MYNRNFGASKSPTFNILNVTGNAKNDRTNVQKVFNANEMTNQLKKTNATYFKMKANILLAVFIGLSLAAFSQNKKFSISTNLLNLVVSGPSLSLSYLYTPALSLQVYGSTGNFLNSQHRFKTAIFDVKYSVFKGGLLKEFYTGPYLRYIDKKIKREGYIDNSGFVSTRSRDFHGKGISSGLLLGFQMQNTRLVNLEIFGGAGYGKYIYEKDYSGIEKQKGFIDGRVGILLGLKF